MGIALYLRKKCDDQSNLSPSGKGTYVVHTGLLKGRAEDLKPDPYLRKSPSLESLSRPPSLGFGSTRLLSTSTGGLRPQSKLRYHVLNSEELERPWANSLVFFLLFYPLWSIYFCTYFLNENDEDTCLPSAGEQGSAVVLCGVT